MTISRPSPGPVTGTSVQAFRPESYGSVDTTGATDSSPAVLACIAAAHAAGGTVVFPPGVIRVDSKITLAHDGHASRPNQESLRLTGAGAPSGNARSDRRTADWQSGTFLDLRYDGGGDPTDPKIDTRGVGVLEIDHIGLGDNGSSSNPFIRTTQTTLSIHDCSFNGNTAKTGVACDQDAIVLGGTTATYDATATSGFCGYGTVIRNNIFDRIRKCVHARTWANSVVVKDNSIKTSCGSAETYSAPFVVDSTVTSGADGFCRGNVFESNLIEVPHYKYAFALLGPNNGSNLLMHNSVWDEELGNPWVAEVYFGVGAAGNIYLPSLNTTQGIQEVNPGTNRVISWRGSMLGGWTFTNPDSAATTPLSVRRAATQLVEMFKVLDAAGNRQWYIGPNGSLRCEANMGDDYPLKVNNDSWAVPAALFANAKGFGVKLGDPSLQAALSLTDGTGAGKVGIFTGTGSPEGSRSAPQGSVYLQQDGNRAQALWIKESGTGNTGWVQQWSRIRALQAGLYYPSPAATSGTGTTTQDMLRMCPFTVTKRTTFTALAMVVTASAVGATFRLGVYADAESYPGALVLDAGTVDASSTGTKEAAISLTLDPGDYWIGGASQGGNPTIQTNNSPQASMGTTNPSTVPAPCAYTQTGVSGALPATFTSTLAVSSVGARVYLKA